MKNGLRACSMQCISNNKKCQKSDCRLYIDYPEEYNCSLISIYENGPMTLRQIGDRIGVSFARIKQIESKALNKIKNSSLISFLN
tara:strand:+ start:378 stop:632 length:255 start_codon:yes stop_codon:yes gene_type:complete